MLAYQDTVRLEQNLLIGALFEQKDLGRMSEETKDGVEG